MSPRIRRHVSGLFASCAVLLAAACSGGGGARDTATAAPAATMGAGANPVDTGMSTTSSSVTGMSRGDSATQAAARDSARSAGTKARGN